MNGYFTYNQNQTVGESAQETEVGALRRCTAKLEDAKREGTSYNDYCDAVRHNQRLWTFFQMALISPENPLPPELSDLLKSLSIYIDKRSLRAFAEHNPQLLTVLININRQVAAGLMQQAEQRAKANGEAMPVDSSATPAYATASSGGGLNIAG